MSILKFGYMKKFNDIIENNSNNILQCKSGKEVKLYKFGSMLYADMKGIYYIIEDLFGSRVSFNIIPYLKKVFFVENLEIFNNGKSEYKDMVCLNLIDDVSLFKVENWIFNEHNRETDDSNLFSNIQMSSNTDLSGAYDKYNSNSDADNSYIICDSISSLSPFSENLRNKPINKIIECAEHSQFESHKIAYDTSFLPKPRGKKMPERKVPTATRPFACTFYGCKRAFKRQEHLKRHCKMHTGERPYTCPFPKCNKSFSRSDNLNSHYKTHNDNGRFR